ncbi:hypothetical protein [Sphingomonas melonis]|uniref:hypothetical protein n=1 Tax=Sphingomonas melonis TaxID=152682 RepID=UPI0035C7E41D
MRIKTLTTFIDKQAKDAADAEVPANKTITVTAERGAELIDLGLAEAVDGEAVVEPAKK